MLAPKSISLGHDTYHREFNFWHKVSIALFSVAMMWVVLLLQGAFPNFVLLSIFGVFALCGVSVLCYSFGNYGGKVAGIKNDGLWFTSFTARGFWAWFLTVMLTVFYIILYCVPEVLGLASGDNSNTGLIALFDPLSYLLKGKPASEWFVYGALYTFIILALGIKFIWKYRHNKYQVIRTLSIIFWQTCIAFILPEILQSLNLPYNDFKNIWPLNYHFFFDSHIDEMIQAGTFGYFMLFWGVASFLIFTPILTYFFGKRWYCSWVCGCGGLAETAGDPFRHLSDKSHKAWKLERKIIYAVFIFAIVMTLAVLIQRFTGIGWGIGGTLSSVYGFLIGTAFSGVIGVGFYPILGSRVWCRYGCPMAAYLGILQKHKSKFRITTNGGQCISCGNCSTQCEMGIDVKSYAQKGEDILRASCVGCGVCSAVCPRGVLRLENL
jgi:Pyruvate/2-oxoacid:ferredoxin oxidoreductase delta subunit